MYVRAMDSRVISFGEMLFDHLPNGLRPGGGPFNTAAHLAALGTRTAIITAVGEDREGTELRQIAEHHGLDTALIQTNYLETGKVHIQLNEVGEPEYDIVAPVAWDLIRWPDVNGCHPDAAAARLPKYCRGAKAILYWMLGVRSEVSRDTLNHVLAHAPLSAPRIVDLGFRQNFYSAELINSLLQQATVAKLNVHEFGECCELLGLAADPEVLAKAYQLEIVIITQGSGGAMAWQAGKTVSAKSPAVDVIDTVGCGDAFLAGFVHSYLQNLPLKECLELACQRGAFAATKAGGLPS